MPPRQNEWHAQVQDRSVFRSYVHQPSPVWRSFNPPAAANTPAVMSFRPVTVMARPAYPFTRTIFAIEGTPRESNATR